MKVNILLLFLITLPSVSIAQLQMELAITPTNFAVYCEPTSLNVTWRNVSEEELVIGSSLKPTESSAVTIFVNDKPVLKFPLPEATKYYSAEEFILKPGESYTGSVGTMLLNLSPGTYQIKAVADLTKLNGLSVHGNETIESKSIEFTLMTPAGESLETWEYAIARTKSVALKEKMVEACVVLRKPDVLNLFPTSIYAAWLVWPKIEDPSREEPRKLKKLIENGYYPNSNSVPDPKTSSGWRELPRGKSMAEWQLEWAERILKSQPDFPFAEKLQLVVALNKLVLDDHEGSLRILTELSKKKNDIGEWSREFVNLK